MPHVLYNHITHAWDQPELDPGGSPGADSAQEAPAFGPVAHRLLPPLALGSATAMAGLILLGLIAGLLLGVS